MNHRDVSHEHRLETLDEFIEATTTRRFPRNAYVSHPGFKELYVRRTKRLLNGEWFEHVLDIARVEVRRPGQGTFKNLVTSLLDRGIPVYVECVQNTWFAEKLEEMGFTRVAGTSGPPSFFKLPVKP
jgi:hypothetical protein